MILRATDVGEFAASILAHPNQGVVKRVFRSSAYLELSGELIILLRGGPKSPISVNLEGPSELSGQLSAGERFRSDKSQLVLQNAKVDIGGAKVYRSSLGDGKSSSPVNASELTKASAMLRLLYQVAEPGLEFIADEYFLDFARRVLRPAGRGSWERVRSFENYLPLIGTGGGFTPSGDDLVGGFAAAFNHAARINGTGELLIPREELLKGTVSESAALVDYAQRGYVDEEVEGLILAAFGDKPGFLNSLLGVASRGHTSGIDLSLGVLLSAALLSGGIAIDQCLDALSRP